MGNDNNDNNNNSSNNNNNNNNSNENNNSSSIEPGPVSWPGLLLISNNGELQVCKGLLGERFFDFTKHGSDVLVACRDGCKLVSPSGDCRPYCKESFSSIASGSAFFVGVTPDGKLYSWGIVGDVGQLGQGANRRESIDPSPIKFNAPFVSAQCGDSFSIALDKHGWGYSFGENFSRQLALYNKPREDMHLSSAVVEDMSFSPRLMAFTQRHPLRRVSCGLHFAVAITRQGTVFSWGAGESGQLGTGRCTRQEVPRLVSFPTAPTLAAVDIACGAGHSLAVLDNGDVYAWGLNQRGQLGLGDDVHARAFPTRVCMAETHSTAWVHMCTVVAEGHSSAALSREGELYTWGSATHGRLLLPAPAPPATSVRIPTRVQSSALDGMRIAAFLFTDTSSAVLVKATLTGLWPRRGPKRAFSRLRLMGFGLWNSSQILVKFTSRVASLYNPPRSVLGKLTSDGHIECKPPKLNEVGWYGVSLSMDGGKEFFPQTFDVLVYKEPTLCHQTPAVLDLRSEIIPSLRLTLQASRELARGRAGEGEAGEEGQEVQVKLSLFRVRAEDVAAAAALPSPSKTPATPSAALWTHTPPPPQRAQPAVCVAEVYTTARIVSDVSDGRDSLPRLGREEGGLGERPVPDPAAVPLTGRSAETLPSVSSSGAAGVRPSTSEVCVVVVTAPVALPAALPAALHDLSCQLSFNGQDYTGGAPSTHPRGTTAAADFPTSLCHAFQPRSLHPACYPLAALPRLVALRGGMRGEDNNTPADSVPSRAIIIADSEAGEGGDEGGEGGGAAAERSWHDFERKVVVHGESFFPGHKLPKGAHIKGRWCACRVVDDTHPLLPPTPLPSSSSSSSSSPPAFLDAIDPLLVHCDGLENMHFTLTSTCLTQLYLHHLRGMLAASTSTSSGEEAAGVAGVQLDLVFELEVAGEGGGTDRVLLAAQPVSLFLYADSPLAVTPPACRRGGGDSAAGDDVQRVRLTPRGRPGFAFPPPAATVQVTFLHPAGGADEVLPTLTLAAPHVTAVPVYPSPSTATAEEGEASADISHDLHPHSPSEAVDGAGAHPAGASLASHDLRAPLGYALEVALPPWSSLVAQYPSLGRTPPYAAVLSAALDGHRYPPGEASARLGLFGCLGRYGVASAVPKGGFPPGAAVCLALDEAGPALPPDTLRVRLYGSDDHVALDVVAAPSEALPAGGTGRAGAGAGAGGGAGGGAVQFVLPDAAALARLGPVQQGKDKWLHVAVSLDGGRTFDKPEKPLVQIK